MQPSKTNIAEVSTNCTTDWVLYSTRPGTSSFKLHEVATPSFINPKMASPSTKHQLLTLIDEIDIVTRYVTDIVTVILYAAEPPSCSRDYNFTVPLSHEMAMKNMCIYCIIARHLYSFSVINPATGQRNSSVAYCYNKNHNSANTYHKNMNEASYTAKFFIIIRLDSIIIVR